MHAKTMSTHAQTSTIPIALKLADTGRGAMFVVVPTAIFLCVLQIVKAPLANYKFNTSLLYDRLSDCPIFDA